MSRSFAGSTNNHNLLTDNPPLTAGPLSMFAWFKTNGALTQTGLLVSLLDKDNNNRFFNMEIGSDAILRIVTRSSDPTTTSFADATTTITASTWQTACVTENVTDRAAYLDGGNMGTATATITPQAIDRLAVGRLMRLTPGNTFNGLLAHIALWNVVLTADEAAMLGAQGGRISPLMVRPQNLVFYSPFLGRNSPEIDIIGGRTLTVTGATSSADEPPLLWLPGRKKIFFIASSGQPIDVVQASEIDSALSVAHTKSKAAGLNAETDSAFAVTAGRLITIGLNTETDSAFSVSHLLSRGAGLNSETDSAQTVAHIKAKAIGLNTEADSVQAIGRAKRLDIGIVAEGDIALPLGTVQIVDVGQAEDVATAFGVGALKSKTVAMAQEIDSPLTVYQWDSGYTIDGENEVELANPYGALTVYSDGAGGFYSIGGTS